MRVKAEVTSAGVPTPYLCILGLPQDHFLQPSCEVLPCSSQEEFAAVLLCIKPLCRISRKPAQVKGLQILRQAGIAKTLHKSRNGLCHSQTLQEGLKLKKPDLRFTSHLRSSIDGSHHLLPHQLVSCPTLEYNSMEMVL